MSDHAMMIRADAKAMGAVTAIDTRVSARWMTSKPSKRTFGGRPFTGTSECISYKADGTASVFSPARTTNARSKTRIVQDNARQSYADRVAQLGAIGNVE